MTVFLPLDSSSAVPSIPAFLVPPTNGPSQLARAIQAIMKAKRIVVVCGAGISVQAGIPDFRSSEGLFQTIKRDNPREAMSSGKELFDASVFNSEHKTSLFCQMIAQLSDLSQAAKPTAFHQVLRSLDDRGRLLRVYTQNIDAIEQKCGLSFGVPEFEGRRSKSRLKGKSKAAAEDVINATDDASHPVASTSRLPSPPAETPRCIPLHGTLQLLHCQVCNYSFPLQEHLPSLVSGQPPSCPECTSLEATRQLVGKRPRGIGKLRPSVVLYNEAHKDGEGVGDVVQKDLIGSSKGKGKSGADLLLVVGTSLKVPGTKRMVREFAKAVRSRGVSSSPKDEPSTPSGSGLVTPAPSPRRSPTVDEEPIPKAVYLNLDFPVPTREWEGVFDAWIQGDAQQFAEILQAEIEKEARAKEVATERKRKRDEEAAVLANSAEHELPDLGRMQEKEKERNTAGAGAKPSKRKTNPNSNANTPQNQSQANKRRRTTMPPSPPYTPPSPQRIASPERDADVDIDELRDSSKLYVRIPALHARRRYVPEVYNKSMRPTPQYVRPHDIINRRRSITPPPPLAIMDYEEQPLPPSHLPHVHYDKRTKAGRKAIRDAQRARSISRAAGGQAQSCGASQLSRRDQPGYVSAAHQHHLQHVDVDMDMDLLPSDMLVRTSQMGIRDPT